MTGVEILNSKVIYNTLFPGTVGLIAIIWAVVLFGIAIWAASENHDNIAFGCIIFTIISVVTAISSVIIDKDSIDYYEYKVTINNEVSMTEFLDKYEILDMEGKIFTVKEIEK